MKKPDREMKEMLRHDLSDAEIADTARKLSTKVEDRASLEEEKKNVASSYKNRIDILDNEINQNSRLISCGYEMRMTECHVFFDDPENGHKRIIRTDTSETLRIEKMAQHELQKELPLDAEAEAVEPEDEDDDAEWNDPATTLPDAETLVLCRVDDGNFGFTVERCTCDDDTGSDDPVWTTVDLEEIEHDRIKAWRHLTDEELEDDEESDATLVQSIEKAKAVLVKRGRIGITEIQNVAHCAYPWACRVYDEMIERGMIDLNGNAISQETPVTAATTVMGQVLISGSGPYKAKIDNHAASSTAGEKQAAEAVIKKAHVDPDIIELVDTGEREVIREGGPEWQVWNFTAEVA